MVMARMMARMMVVMVILQVRSLPEDKQEDFFQLSIARFIVFENKHFDIEEKQSMNRPAICTKDRTESMMMGIFQTNSITIRCILRSGFEHIQMMVNIGMGMIVKSLKLGNICAEPQYFQQGA